MPSRSSTSPLAVNSRSSACTVFWPGSRGNVGDVVAVVGGFGPFRVAGLEALGAQLGAVGQGADLHAGVVVIKLAVHLPALGLEQVANGVAQRGLAAMAHVQRAGGVGRDELDQHISVLAISGEAASSVRIS
jgi:hypothetical protein